MPSISHLLFADDSLFFLKASCSNLFILKAILEEYLMLSGQKVSFDKSKVEFSKNVSAHMRYEIVNALGVEQKMCHYKYLGLPFVFLVIIKLNFLSSLLKELGKSLWVGSKNCYL